MRLKMTSLGNVSDTLSLPLNRTYDGPEFFKRSWILAQILNSVLTIGAAWTLIAFVSYGTRHGKWNRTNKRRSKTATLMILGTICPSTLVLRLLTTQALIIVEKLATLDSDGDNACEVVVDCSVLLFSLSTLPAYFFLWYRQRMLYSQPSLKHLNTKVVRFFSWTFIVLLLLGGSSSAFISTIPVTYQMSNFGCVQRMQKPPNYKANYITALTLIISQLILFGLFCHPLRLHKQSSGSIRRHSSKASTKSRVTNSTKQEKKKEKKDERVYNAIKSATISMGICVLSDIFAVVMVTVVLKRNTPLSLTRSLYDFSLFVNLIAVIFCFDDFEKILFGVCTGTDYNKVRRQSSAARTHTATSSFM